MSKVKRTKHLRRKSETNHLIIGGTKMMMMTRRKKDVSIATVLITQQKIADTFIQKKLMRNFESNTPRKNRVKWP
jgi:hypothetical protein